VKASRRLVAALAGALVVALLLGYVAAQERPAAREAAAAAQAPAQEAPAAREVVIVWSGGTPGAPPLPPPDAGAVDVITQATPETGGIKEIAEKLAKELEAAGHSALVISAEECRDPRVIMRAKALVVASPEYFGLPTWQMVRFFDETLYRLYRARVQLSNHVVAAFATGERTLGILEGVLKSTRGKAVQGAVISARGTSAADIDASVKQLAERIAAGLSGGSAPSPQ
jgi:flavodoxin